MQPILSSLRAAAVTMLVCCFGYFGVVLAFAGVVTPGSAAGSLIERDGVVVGSSQVAQAFTSPGYLWPRPSAVDYDGGGAGGSNLSPLNPLLAERAGEIVTAMDVAGPLPAELVAASGSGLDPHVTLEGALVQAPRIAAARGVPADRIETILHGQSASASGFSSEDVLVNVLLANLALDEALR